MEQWHKGLLIPNQNKKKKETNLNGHCTMFCETVIMAHSCVLTLKTNKAGLDLHTEQLSVSDTCSECLREKQKKTL